MTVVYAMSPRRKKPSEDRKEQIRDAAYRAFQRSGYHSTTVDAICTGAHCSKGSFYWHYPSKRDVFLDILNTWAQEVISELIKQFESTVYPEDFNAELTTAMQREISRGRHIVPLWLEFTVEAQRNEQVQKSIAKFYRRARTAIAELIRPISKKALSEDVIQSVSAAIFGLYMGLITQELADAEEFNADRIAANIIPLFGHLLNF